jgi:hypothetical protein
MVRPWDFTVLMMSHRLRRAWGSRPVEGSSRKTRSGRLKRASASSSRCFCPPEILSLSSISPHPDGTTESSGIEMVSVLSYKPAESFQGFGDRQIREQGGLLKHDADLLPELRRPARTLCRERSPEVGAMMSSTISIKCGFAGTVGSQQAEAAALVNRQADTIHRSKLFVTFVDVNGLKQRNCHTGIFSLCLRQPTRI